MNYEEYEARTTAQKRKPVEREHYEECIERGYMALGTVDKDEYCRLSDAVQSAAANLARRIDEANARAKGEKEAARLANARAAEAETKVVNLTNERDVLQNELAARDALIDRFIRALPPSKVRELLLDR